MKKLTTFIVAVVLILSLAACGTATNEAPSSYGANKPSEEAVISGSSSARISDDIKGALWALAKQSVKTELKSPSSANFPFSYASDGVSISQSGYIYGKKLC